MFGWLIELKLLFGGSFRRPLITALRLLFGLTRPLTLPSPVPSPDEILRQEDLVIQRYNGITMLRQISLFRTRDNPTMSLYRMYEFICADESNQLMLEVNYFWTRITWPTASIPDPNDGCPERQAILAAVTECLVTAFNYRYSMGLRRDDRSTIKLGLVSTPQEVCPAWTATVPPLSKELRLYDDPYAAFYTPPSNPFSDRNVVANAGNIFSI